MSDLSQFFSEVSQEEKKRLQSGADNARSEMGAVAIAYPGKYVCEIPAFSYKERDTNKTVCFPDIFISPKKGSLNLVLSFKVVDGTDKVPKGASIFMNIVLVPKDKSQENIDKILMYTKPRLMILTGTTHLDMTQEWFEEWLMPKFEWKNDQFVLIKDHKMKQRVLVTVDEKQGTDDKIRLSVVDIAVATPSEKSVSFDMKNANATIDPALNMNVSDRNISYEEAQNSGVVAAPNIPDMEAF